MLYTRKEAVTFHGNLKEERLNTSRSLRSFNGARKAFLVKASRKHNAKPREEMPRDENDSLEIMFNSSSSINAENVSYYSSLSRNDSATGWHDETADWNNIEVASVNSRGDHVGSGCRVTPVEKLEGLSDRSSSPRNSFESDETLVSDREPEYKPSNRIVTECTPRIQQLFHPTHASGDKNLEAGEATQHSGTPGALSETSAVIRLQRWWRRHLCRQKTEAVMLEQLLAEEKRRIGGRVSSLASTPRSARKPVGSRTPRVSISVSLSKKPLFLMLRHLHNHIGYVFVKVYS
ncbi:unnamed protein product [Dibothriocephalus latus]|uniref:Uncharacterized protein n=1 Tax=Dibothriocephalus latus TaxID=60516 RepID=A0A3P7LL82_DIBLA|nr:unnamed protein product [Dibothriocephalus latus]